MVLGSVLYILYLSIFGIWLVSAWTLKYRTNSALFMMNQMLGLYVDRLRSPGKVPGAPSKRASTVFCAVLYNLMMTMFGAYLAVTVIPVISRNNPGEVVLSWILPENYNETYLNKIFSCLYIGVSGYFGSIPLIQVFCYATAILFEIKYLLKRAYGGSGTSDSMFHRQWIVYSENILLVREINQFGSHIYPDIMLTAFSINVVMTMVCIKFLSKPTYRYAYNFLAF